MPSIRYCDESEMKRFGAKVHLLLDPKTAMSRKVRTNELELRISRFVRWGLLPLRWLPRIER